jgi:hypothetical protein
MKISEKMLEDWICENPQYAIGAYTEIIGRQISLPHDRLDILAWEIDRINVIELKARPLKEKDIGQVGRYACDVSHIIARIGTQERPKPENNVRSLQHTIYEDKWHEYHGNWEHEPVHPILIGSQIDEQTLAAAAGIGIDIRLWHYDEATNEIIVSFPNYNCLCADIPPYPNWALRLNELIKVLCVKESDREFTQEIKALFGEYGSHIMME